MRLVGGCKEAVPSLLDLHIHWAAVLVLLTGLKRHLKGPGNDSSKGNRHYKRSYLYLEGEHVGNTHIATGTMKSLISCVLFFRNWFLGFKIEILPTSRCRYIQLGIREFLSIAYTQLGGLG